ncbi:MAG: metallophosphoesterase [Candidatus Heimdallarchaeaceae archaeon]|jgi:putative SbcD/Mre11-related phosphoesterase
MEPSFFKIEENLLIVDSKPLLYLKDVNTLVLADLHIGFESIMLEDGTSAPFNQTQELADLISNYIRLLKPDKLVLNGDIKHSFHELTKIENRDVKKFLQAVSPLVKEVHIIKGNHDTFLNWVVRDIENATFHESHYVLGKYFFTHGDEHLPDSISSEVQYVIIAHEHPVLAARINGLQKIRSLAFLFGPLKNRTSKIIVLPAFSSYSTGTPIHPSNVKHLLSPILREEADLLDFELFVLSDSKEVFHFPSFKLWM